MPSLRYMMDLEEKMMNLTSSGLSHRTIIVDLRPYVKLWSESFGMDIIGRFQALAQSYAEHMTDLERKELFKDAMVYLCKFKRAKAAWLFFNQYKGDLLE